MKFFLSAALALALTPLCARAVPVTVRVADADGQPVAGATARVVDYANWVDDDNRLPASVENRANADGVFALDLTGTQGNPKLLGAREGGIMGLGGARVMAPGFGTVNAILFAGENKVVLGESSHVEGVVRDEAGAPVAGARVELEGVEQSPGGFGDINASSGLKPETVVTDTQGRWQMDGLARGYGSFVASAPNFVATEGIVDLSGNKVVAAPIVLPPAGTVRGRIVDAQGKGLASVHVYWDGGYGSKGDEFYSDANGNFLLDDVPLGVGENELSFSRLNADWLGVDKRPEIELERAGQVEDIGEIRESAGLLLSGRIVDNGGQPVEGVELRAFYSTLKSGADGRFEGRVSKPFYSLDILNSYGFMENVDKGEPFADATDLGDLKVARLVKVPLELHDETGALVPQARMGFTAVDNPQIGAQNNTVFGTESPSIGPLAPGDYKIGGGGLWEVVAPLSVRVDAQDPAPTLKITLRRLQPLVVSGRVIDERGKPIAGAGIVIIRPTYGSAISGRDGTWRVEMRPGEGEPMLTRPTNLREFTQLRGGELSRADDGSWRASDIVMSRLNATLKGRCVGADGAAVAGARVLWSKAPVRNVVIADKDGRFELTNLPAEPVEIMASDGPRFATARAQPDANLELQLPPATAPFSAEKLEELWRATPIKDFSRLDPYYEILGPKRLFETARRLDGNGNPVRAGGALDEYLKMRAQHARTPAERESVASEGVTLLFPFDVAALQGEGAATVALLAAHSDDAENRQWAARWFDAQNARLRPLDQNAVPWNPRLNEKDGGAIAWALRLAAVGDALGRDDAPRYRAWALKAIEPFGGDFRPYYRGVWNDLLWQSGPQVFEDAIKSWTPTDQMGAIAAALQNADDVETARALLARLEKLNADSSVIAAQEAEKKERPNYQTSRETYLTNGRIGFVRAVAPLDAKLALQVLETTGQTHEAREAALFVARAALANNQTEIAKRAVALGAQDTYNNRVGASSLALMAQTFAPDEAAKLLERASDVAKVEGVPAYVRETSPLQQLENYAFALRPFDAGLGRLLIEEQWARQQEQPRRPDDDWQRAQAQEKLAWALSVYDLPRALQWLESVEDNRGENSHKDTTRIAILAAAFATPEQRAFVVAANPSGY